jgi:hypothetical protein
MWLMVALQTIGSVDITGKGPRKLPAPKVYVAIVIVWSILGLVSDAGQSRAAALMGWLMVLTGMVVGPFGTTAVKFLNTVAANFGAAPIQPGGTA